MTGPGRRVEIVEVGPRDGLQAETAVLPVATRVDLIRRLEAAGAQRIEVVSFANPDRVPQMAGAEEIASAIGERRFSAIGLVLNPKGLERAADCGLDEVNLVAYASDGYAGKNSNATAERRNAESASLAAAAAEAGYRVTVTIAVAYGDPVEGPVPPERVVDIAAAWAAAGAHEIALGDTIGVAVPSAVRTLLAGLASRLPGTPIRCHFHNTRNTGYANAFAAIEGGVTTLDGSVGGFGGSPFSPGAGGNVATEDLALMLERDGIGTGIDAGAMAATGIWLAGVLGHDAPKSMAGLAAPWPPAT
jgi:hydroxymethylglutaryl-CoA lyase